MPGMPRIKNIGQKIAFSILGTPANIREKKTVAQKEIDRKLLSQNTQRAR